MRNAEIVLHENNEYILEENFLEVIVVYVHLLLVSASQGKDMDNSADDDKWKEGEEPKCQEAKNIVMMMTSL